MKKKFYLPFFTFVFLTFFTSCSSDDNNPIIEEPIVTVIGKWSLYATDLKVELDGEVFIDYKDVPEEGIEYHFKENGMVDVLYFDPDTKQEEEMRTVSYQITDDKLKIENTEYTILLIDSHALHINLYYEGYNNTMEAYEKVSITQKLEKM